MSKTMKLLVGLVVLAAAGAALFVGGMAFQRHNSDIPRHTLAIEPYKELLTDDPRLWMVEHFPGPDGNDVAQRIYYKDSGEIGLRVFGANHQRSQETTWFEDGSVRMRAVYAADGQQVVSGFELRSDRTKLWTATTQDNIVTRTTHWYDGNSVFSVEKRAVDAGIVDVTYFYKSGKPWMHYLGKPYQTSQELMARMNQVQVWGNDGTKLVEMTADDQTGKVSVYRANGTLAYQQDWETFPWYRLPDGSVLKRQNRVTVFSEDGSRPARVLDLAPGMGSISKVTDYAADGSRVEYTVSPWGSVRKAESFDKEGKKTGDVDLRTVRLQMDETVSAEVRLPAPVGEWTTQEGDPTVRDRDGSPKGVTPISPPAYNDFE